MIFRLDPVNNKNESSVSTVEAWGDDDDLSLPLDDIVQKLDSCTETTDQEHIATQANLQEDIFMTPELEMNKINELIQIVQGDDSTECLPSPTPSSELTELIPIEGEKMQQVELLINKLLGEKPDLVSDKLTSNITELLCSDNVDKPCSSELNLNTVPSNQLTDNYTHEDMQNMLDNTQQSFKSFDSPSAQSQQNLNDLEGFVEKLNQSDYIDPDECDPFEDYIDESSSINSDDSQNICIVKPALCLNNNSSGVNISNVSESTHSETEDIDKLEKALHNDYKAEDDIVPTVDPIISILNPHMEKELKDMEAPYISSKNNIESGKYLENKETLLGDFKNSTDQGQASPFHPTIDNNLSNSDTSDKYFSAESSPVIEIQENSKAKKLFPLFIKGNFSGAKKG